MASSFPSTPPSASRFTFQRLLGSGASAQVWLVVCEDGLERALKCFPASNDPVGAPSAVRRSGQLRREIRISANFQHGHLLAVHDVIKLTGAWSGGTGLLMEYASGGSLAAVLASRGRISAGELVTVLVPMFQALAFLHRRGAAHGDVSATNVLFSEVGKPLLADFGAARISGEGAEGIEGILFGTPGFVDPARLQPDQADAAQSADAAADVYAMSVLGWWCLSGEAPARHGMRPTARASGTELAPRLASSTDRVEARLFGLLAAGMDLDRCQRPPAAELARELFQIVAAEPIDLMASVHPSVLPHLLTRRQLRPVRQSQGLRSVARRVDARSVDKRSAGGRRAAVMPPHGRRRGLVGQALISRILISRTLFNRTWTSLSRIGLARIRLAGRSGWWAVFGVVITGSALALGSMLLAAANPAPATSDNEATADAGSPRSLQFSDDPRQAIRALSWLRAEAFRTGDAALLAAVNLPGSPAAQADQQTMAALTESARVLANFSATVRQAEITSATDQTDAKQSDAGRAVVAAQVELSPYAETDASGVVFNQQLVGRSQVLTFALTKQSGRWLIVEVLAAN